jgi:hypothetical protein
VAAVIPISLRGKHRIVRYYVISNPIKHILTLDQMAMRSGQILHLAMEFVHIFCCFTPHMEMYAAMNIARGLMLNNTIEFL